MKTEHIFIVCIIGNINLEIAVYYEQKETVSIKKILLTQPSKILYFPCAE